MSVPMPTRSELKRFAPKARPEYIQAILDGEEHLRKAGILHHRLTWCHFVAQSAAETAYWTIWEENLNYKSVTRIRQVWPARTRKLSDEKLQSLVNNPRALANEMYGSRMGNRRGTDDGFTYLGRGFFQSTGRYAYEKYAKQLGVPLTQNLNEDYNLSLMFACLEWASSGCNSLALENDILGISRAINVGSATSSVMPNGMEHRKRGLKRAWAIWGDPKRTHIPDVSDVTEKTLKDLGSETFKASDLLKGGAVAGGVASGSVGAASESGTVATVPVVTTTQTVEQANDSLRTANESVNLVTEFMGSIKGFWLLLSTNLWIVGVACAVAGYFAVKQIRKRRLLDARMGQNLGRLDQIISDEDPLADAEIPDVIPRA